MSSAQTTSPEVEGKYMTTLAAAYLALLKTALLYDLGNEVFARPVGLLREIVNRLLEQTPRLSLCALGDFIYVNRTLIRMDAGTYDQLRSVVRILEPLKAQEIVFKEKIQDTDVMQLLGAVKGAYGQPDGAERLRAQVPAKFEIREATQTGVKQVEMTDRMRALRTYLAALLTVKDMTLGIDERREISLASVKRAVQDLVAMVFSQEGLMLGLITLPRYRGSPFNHLLNTSVIVSALCHRLGASRKQSIQAAFSAVVHDFDWTGNGDVETTVRHLVRLYRGDRMGRLRIVSAADVGNPGGMAAARLISVASAFDRMTSPKAPGGTLAPDEALRRIQADVGRLYDGTAVRLLVQTMGVYPIGSMVTLSDGSLGVVVELPPDGRSPARPLVKLVRDPSGGTTDGRVEDLMVPGTPQIVRVLPPEQLELNPSHFFLA